MKRKFFHPISKRFGVFGLVLTVLLTMVMIVANVALSRYSNTISSTLDLNKQISAGGDEATYQKARNLTQEIAGEGATLLKNTNGALPLDIKKINVFGYGSVNLVYGGSGSGSTSGASYNDTLKQSFEAEGLRICGTTTPSSRRAQAPGTCSPPTAATTTSTTRNAPMCST